MKASEEYPNIHDYPLKSADETDIIIFVREGCSHCAEAKKFLKALQAEHPDLRISYRDVVKDPQALRELKDLAAAVPELLVAVPTFLLKGKVISGFSGPEGTGEYIQTLLGYKTQETRLNISLPFVGELDLKNYSLPAFTIIIGLMDGVNPCAMWVLLFIIALLVHFKSRQKMFLVAGVFVLVSGIVYFLFMIAWLNIFLLIGAARPIQIFLGCLALFAGGVHVKDYFAFKKGISLSIPNSAKPWIGKKISRVLEAENSFAILVAVCILAFLVNIVELLCTAGLPAIYTQILSTHHLPAWQYYGYLILYNIAYMFDDSIVVFLAVLTLNPQRLSEKKGLYLKLISGTIMIGLGVLLLVKPQWLYWD